MSDFFYYIDFFESGDSHISGSLELGKLLRHANGLYRQGRLELDGYPTLELVLYHSDATAKFMYIRNNRVDVNLLETIGLSKEEIASVTSLRLPGQLCLGAERTRLIGRAVKDLFGAPPMRNVVTAHRQENLAIFPIAREGLKYQVAEVICDNYNYYCDEIILDAHHVFDSSVPVYNRKVEMTLFKDKDLDKEQHDNIKVAFIADSIASGLVMKETVLQVEQRFKRVQQIEVISPLATVRGLCNLARVDIPKDTRVRVHVFETLLNALLPDYYYSAHFNIPEFHIYPELEEEYREWWGKDSRGTYIADTACAGYGWSEVFFSPRKQIQMINSELESRHKLTIADVVRRHL